MSDMERVMIGSVALGKTKGGKPVADLFSTDKRLEFPVLRLFDLSMLETVGINPNELGSDPVHKRFWAYYTESEKTTAKGNPYRDCQYLEPIDKPATTTSTDNSALLAELRAIRTLLEIAVTRNGFSLPQMALGDSENADWLLDEETQAEELALHDELEAKASQNGNDASALDEAFPRPDPELATAEVPTASGAMVEYLNGRGKDPSCSGVGHLIYVMKKRNGNGWGWPNSEDQAGWRQVVSDWDAYWADIN